MTFAAACGARASRGRWVGPYYERGDLRLRVTSPGPAWTPVTGPGDLAWTEPRTRAVVGVNATCVGHKDAPLPVLVNDLLLGTTRRKTLLEESTVLADREALHVVTSASLDGVPLVYDLYVLKKDGCVYDLTLVSAPRSYEAAALAFGRTVAGFEAHRRRMR